MFISILMYTKVQKVASRYQEDHDDDVILYSWVVRSPGFALSLVAESTTGALISGEKAAEAGMTAEDVGLLASKILLREVSKGGCVDTTSQWLNLLLMVLCPEDVSKIRIGQLTPFT